MSTAAKNDIMRRKRDRHLDNIQAIQEYVNDYQQANENDDSNLQICEAQLEEEWKQFQLVRKESKGLDDKNYTQECKTITEYISLNNQTRELMEGKRPSTPLTLKCSSNTSSSIQASNDNLNKNSNDIQTPPTENIVSNLSPIPSHDTRSSSSKRDLATTASALSQQSDLTSPNGLNQTTSNDPLDSKEKTQRSSVTMANATKLNSLRSNLMNQFTVVSKLLDEYKQSDRQNKSTLLLHEKQLKDIWHQFDAIHCELVSLDDEEEYARFLDIQDQYYDIVIRVKLIDSAQPASPSKPTNPQTVFEPTSIKLPEIRLPTFNGAIEDWHYFYDWFSSIIDRNEQLSPVQKFHYLRLSLTGKAARSIQSLSTTNLNYSIAIDLLKEKFGCHRRACMRHWELISDYPKITKETPEAIDDFLDTVEMNLRALEKLGEPVTSNVILIKVFTSKLPSATIREWQYTLPNNKMPSYSHLIDFLKSRTNGDRSFTSTATKRASGQRRRHRRNAS